MDELLFSVEGSQAKPATPITLAEAGLRERADLQEWILANTDILGPGVMAVSFEFDQWRNSSGDRERDRLDVLGLCDDGRLLVAELKRDRAPDVVEMQAIKYAALVSRFTPESLAAHFARFLEARGETVSDDEAMQRLVAHAGPLEQDMLRQPRIVLVAGSFPPVVTSTVVWLNEMGIDVALQRVQAYRLHVGEAQGIVVSSSRVYPLPDVEEFIVSPTSARARATERRAGRNNLGSPVRRLINARVVEDGTPLELTVPSSASAEGMRDAIERWIAADLRRGRARWQNTRPPLVWEVDGKAHRPSELVKQIVFEAAGATATVQGIRWWLLPDGVDLGTKAAALGTSFDWAALHEVLHTLPPGRWTTYGDLAQLIGTSAQPLGGHIARCEECENAWRVLASSGRFSAGFAWSDTNDMRSPKDVLADEGVAFVDDQADPAKRLTLDELRALVEE